MKAHDVKGSIAVAIGPSSFADEDTPSPGLESDATEEAK